MKFKAAIQAFIFIFSYQRLLSYSFTFYFSNQNLYFNSDFILMSSFNFFYFFFRTAVSESMSCWTCLYQPKKFQLQFSSSQNLNSGDKERQTLLRFIYTGFLPSSGFYFFTPKQQSISNSLLYQLYRSDMDKIDEDALGRMNNVRKIYRSRRIKTEKQESLGRKQVKLLPIKCEPFMKALKQISLKNTPKPNVVNLSIPVRSSQPCTTKISAHQIKSINSKDFFVKKLRRKQQTRSKLLLERLQTQSKTMSLLELCQKWRQSAIQPDNIRDRAQTIKEMKKKIKQRSQFCYSQNKNKPSSSNGKSRLNL